jgi:hypothetical protein
VVDAFRRRKGKSVRTSRDLDELNGAWYEPPMPENRGTHHV